MVSLHRVPRLKFMAVSLRTCAYHTDAISEAMLTQGGGTMGLYSSRAITFPFERAGLRDWCNDALSANHTYYRVRREYFDRFTSLRDPPDEVEAVRIPSQIFITIRSFLCTRSPEISDDKRLAFDTAVMEILELCD